MSDPSRRIAPFLLASLALLGAGCGRHLQNTLGLPNQRPQVRLESAPVTGDEKSAAAALHWSATDPDGRVDHYLVTDDLRTFAKDEGWTATALRDRVLSLRRAAQRGIAVPVAESERLRFFAVKAVDDRGLASTPAYRAYFDENLAPTVTIVHPQPSRLIAVSVPPDLIIRWTGSDPDGPGGKPLKYKFRLFSTADPTIPLVTWLQDPDSLRRRFAPTFAGWDSLPGDSTQVHYSNLDYNGAYVFAITAIDADGAYDPVFALDKNVLRFVVAFQGGPGLAMFNESFSYTYSGFIGVPDPYPADLVIPLAAPAGVPLTIQWHVSLGWGSGGFGTPARPAGATPPFIYRWALDLADVNDATPRRNRNDVRHWSAFDPQATSITITDPILSKLVPAESHRLFVEVCDDLGWKTLGVVEFRFVTPTYDRDLLIVDDTRFLNDMAVPGNPDSLRPPNGPWPTRAELDTLLFAVGGVRWRMTPPGTTSRPGLFGGYAYDTLDTRTNRENPSMSLDLLSHYRHVVWITDVKGSGYSRVVPTHPDISITGLRYLSSPGRENTLAAWVKGGGQLWAVGGGFANATNAAWPLAQTSPWPYPVYSSTGYRAALGPGRFMYDLAHWRSAFAVSTPIPHLRIERYTGAPTAAVQVPGWMNLRHPYTDPLWPFRNNLSYPTSAGFEFLVSPNAILEDANPSPVRTDEVQVLDTLMVGNSPLMTVPAGDTGIHATMTWYHGRECGSVVFSGFDLWSWRENDCRWLIDAVLQGIWGLPKNAPVAAARSGGPAPGGSSRR